MIDTSSTAIIVTLLVFGMLAAGLRVTDILRTLMFIVLIYVAAVIATVI